MKSLRRVFEERAACERQRADQPVAERIMDHCRASARRVKADLFFRLQHDDLGVADKVAAADKPAMPPPMIRISEVCTVSGGGQPLVDDFAVLA